MDAILDETQIEKMIKLAYGKQIDEETETKIAHSIYISIIVQNLYKKLKPYWGTIYKDSFDAEKDLRTEDSKNEKAKIEVDFKTGIEEFLLYFDELSCSNLTYYIKKKFRRYRFKEINRVNDYTILYFTYRLYEIYCNECLDDVDADEIAENFSTMAPTDKELDEFNKISDEVIEYIDNKVESLLYGVKFEMNAYKKIIEPVELDIFNPCILNIDLFQNQRYIDMIEYLESILF